MPKKKTGRASFNNLGISPKLLGQMTKLKFEKPTPIQSKSIPIAIEGQDIIGIAQTGTGKTLAFAVPMIQQISREGGTGLVMLPTRELAEQVEVEFSKLGGQFGLRTAVLIGGASMNRQINKLRAKPHVIIATPGRLIDHIEQKNLSLKNVRYLVLDEADRMLDMGFEPQIRKVLANVPDDRQTFLFSATMPDKISKITRKYMNNPERVEVAPAGTAAELVKQEGYVVERHQRNRLLVHLLSKTSGKMLVFSRTKHGARKIAIVLRRSGYKAAEIHSDRSQAQRRQALEGFKSGKYQALIATDIASRGIDVSNIEFVINYDLPDQIEDYIHRIGRTGRAGKEGVAISFVSRDQKEELGAIENLVHNRLHLRDLPELPDLPPAPKRASGDKSHSGGYKGRGNKSGNKSGYKSGGRKSGPPRHKRHKRK